jgi:hypothetical protein
MNIEEQVDPKLTQLARKMGAKRASILLSVLGKNKQFLSALDTPIGQELLKDAVSEMERIIQLILNEKEKDTDKADLRAYKSITQKWADRLARYNKDKETFNKNVV